MVRECENDPDCLGGEDTKWPPPSFLQEAQRGRLKENKWIDSSPCSDIKRRGIKTKMWVDRWEGGETNKKFLKINKKKVRKKREKYYYKNENFFEKQKQQRLVCRVWIVFFFVGWSCYMASCLLLGMPRMSLENGWTAMGADVGVNPAALALPPPLLYHPEAAAEALLAAIIELTPCW